MPLAALAGGLLGNWLSARRQEQDAEDASVQRMGKIMGLIADPENTQIPMDLKAEAHKYLIDSLHTHGRKEDKALIDQMDQVLTKAIPYRYGLAQAQKQPAPTGPDQLPTSLGLQAPQTANYGLSTLAPPQQTGAPATGAADVAGAAAAPAEPSTRRQLVLQKDGSMKTVIVPNHPGATASGGQPFGLAPPAAAATTTTSTQAAAPRRSRLGAVLGPLAGVATGVEQAFTGIPRNVTRNWPNVPDESVVLSPAMAAQMKAREAGGAAAAGAQAQLDALLAPGGALGVDTLTKQGMKPDEIQRVRSAAIEKAGGVPASALSGRTRTLGKLLSGGDPRVRELGGVKGKLYQGVVDETGELVKIYEAADAAQTISKAFSDKVFAYEHRAQNPLSHEQAVQQASADIIQSGMLGMDQKEMNLFLTENLAQIERTPESTLPTLTAPTTPTLTPTSAPGTSTAAPSVGVTGPTGPPSPVGSPTPTSVQQPGGGTTYLAPPDRPGGQPVTTQAMAQPQATTPQPGGGRFQFAQLTQPKPGGGVELSDAGKRAALGLGNAVTPGMTAGRGGREIQLARENAELAVAQVMGVTPDKVVEAAGELRAQQQAVQDNTQYLGNLERVLGQLDEQVALYKDAARDLNLIDPRLLNRPWMALAKLTTTGNQKLDNYLVSINAMNKTYTQLTAGGVMSKGMPPPDVAAKVGSLNDEAMTAKDAIWVASRIVTEGDADRRGYAKAIAANKTAAANNLIMRALAGRTGPADAGGGGGRGDSGATGPADYEFDPKTGRLVKR